MHDLEVTSISWDTQYVWFYYFLCMKSPGKNSFYHKQLMGTTKKSWMGAKHQKGNSINLDMVYLNSYLLWVISAALPNRKQTFKQSHTLHLTLWLQRFPIWIVPMKWNSVDINWWIQYQILWKYIEASWDQWRLSFHKVLFHVLNETD